MSKVQEALKVAIRELEILRATAHSDAYTLCKSALADIEKCEPVGELERAIKVLEADAKRYRFLRNQTINEDLMPPRDGIFIGQIPQNLVLTAEHADEEIDKAMENNNEQH